MDPDHPRRPGARTGTSRRGFTLGTAAERAAGVTPKHWNARTRTEHEGYVAGYFIEMGIAHHIATGGKDRRLYDAAIRLADCWCRHIGPGERPAGVVRRSPGGRAGAGPPGPLPANDTEGPGHGQKYIDLAKFLLDSRKGGSEYDQSYAPITHQYRAVGHAVRASYTYSAMADVAMETGDPGYWSATRSIWDNLVNRKLYVTGGIGSGETSEGFGPDYSLPLASAYCESCSSCGLVFMQHKLNLATADAKYADLFETTLYNAVLGDCDLPGHNFTYTNSPGQQRGPVPVARLPVAAWGTSRGRCCSCPRGSTPPAATRVREPVRRHDGRRRHRWRHAAVGHAGDELPVGRQSRGDGEAGQASAFAVHVRSPVREVSTLYTATPASDGLTNLTVNGSPVDAKVVDGYVTVTRTWQPGDTVAFELPLAVQWVHASDKVASTRGRAAIRRGPVIYNVETADGQDVTRPVDPEAKLTAEWTPDLLGGVVAIHGTWADGSPLTAVPNYARLNRGGRSLVW